jgi:thermitase
VVKWWAGSKLLVMVSFPANSTHSRATAVVGKLKQLPAVGKVVAASASNLEFQPGDFVREFQPGEQIPDVARRGFDAEWLGKRRQTSEDIPAMLAAPHAPNRLIVRWKDEHVWKAEQTGFTTAITEFHRGAGCRVVRDHRLSPTKLSQLVEFDDPSELAPKLKRYLESGFVAYVQPDYRYEALAIPNDPAYNGWPGPQWNLQIISAEQAWDLTQGDSSVIIAVADSGAPVDGWPRFDPATTQPHIEFASNLWHGQNRVYSDPQAEAENIHDFYDNDHSVADAYGHGTHVASIIAARGNNEIFMTGVAWKVSLMILKVMGPSGNFAPPGSTTDETRAAFSSSVSAAIGYASANQATAINLSLGGPQGNQYDAAIMDRLRQIRETALRHNLPGLLAVAAAGNGGQNNDYNTIRHSPSSIPLDNVISVGATDKEDKHAVYSNYGRYRVDLGAPGGSKASPCEAPYYSRAILGLWRGYSPGTPPPVELDPPWEPPPEALSVSPHGYCYDGPYAFLEGTSQAAPHVAGVAALVKSRFKWENYLGIRDRILMGVDHVVEPLTGNLRFDGVFRTKGRLNAFKSLHKRTLIRNISTRARVESGDGALIGGFFISNSVPVSGHTPAPLKIAVRGLGPSVGVTVTRLQDPHIELFDSSGASLASNDNWATDAHVAELPPSLVPHHPSESAMVRTLPPGGYTVVVTPKQGTPPGVGLVEIYELSDGTNEERRLINLSTRCIVGTGEEAPIAGMIVGEFTTATQGRVVPVRRFNS